jgi:hypothetical protein
VYAALRKWRRDGTDEAFRELRGAQAAAIESV